MLGLIKETIYGKFVTYTKIKALQGYCFYDVDETEEERHYITEIDTPLLDETELERKYVSVYGNADLLNEELEKLREEKAVENEHTYE